MYSVDGASTLNETTSVPFSFSILMSYLSIAMPPSKSGAFHVTAMLLHAAVPLRFFTASGAAKGNAKILIKNIIHVK